MTTVSSQQLPNKWNPLEQLLMETFHKDEPSFQHRVGLVNFTRVGSILKYSTGLGGRLEEFAKSVEQVTPMLIQLLNRGILFDSESPERRPRRVVDHHSGCASPTTPTSIPPREEDIVPDSLNPGDKQAWHALVSIRQFLSRENRGSGRVCNWTVRGQTLTVKDYGSKWRLEDAQGTLLTTRMDELADCLAVFATARYTAQGALLTTRMNELADGLARSVTARRHGGKGAMGAVTEEDSSEDEEVDVVGHKPYRRLAELGRAPEEESTAVLEDVEGTAEEDNAEEGAAEEDADVLEAVEGAAEEDAVVEGAVADEEEATDTVVLEADMEGAVEKNTNVEGAVADVEGASGVDAIESPALSSVAMESLGSSRNLQPLWTPMAATSAAVDSADDAPFSTFHLPPVGAPVNVWPCLSPPICKDTIRCLQTILDKKETHVMGWPWSATLHPSTELVVNQSREARLRVTTAMGTQDFKIPPLTPNLALVVETTIAKQLYDPVEDCVSRRDANAFYVASNDTPLTEREFEYRWTAGCPRVGSTVEVQTPLLWQPLLVTASYKDYFSVQGNIGSTSSYETSLQVLNASEYAFRWRYCASNDVNVSLRKRSTGELTCAAHSIMRQIKETSAETFSKMSFMAQSVADGALVHHVDEAQRRHVWKRTRPIDLGLQDLEAKRQALETATTHLQSLLHQEAVRLQE